MGRATADLLPTTVFAGESGTLPRAIAISLILRVLGSRNGATAFDMRGSLVPCFHIGAGESETAIATSEWLVLGVYTTVSKCGAPTRPKICLRVLTCRVRCSVRAKLRPHRSHCFWLGGMMLTTTDGVDRDVAE